MELSRELRGRCCCKWQVSVFLVCCFSIRETTVLLLLLFRRSRWEKSWYIHGLDILSFPSHFYIFLKFPSPLLFHCLAFIPVLTFILNFPFPFLISLSTFHPYSHFCSKHPSPLLCSFSSPIPIRIFILNFPAPFLFSFSTPIPILIFIFHWEN